MIWLGGTDRQDVLVNRLHGHGITHVTFCAHGWDALPKAFIWGIHIKTGKRSFEALKKLPGTEAPTIPQALEMWEHERETFTEEI
jgi:hypothetical protein